MYESLQPLRVSAGWTVTRHLFFEEEIDSADMDDVRETLFHAIAPDRRRAIDLEWVPDGSLNGYYELTVVNLTAIYNEVTHEIDQDHDWESPYYNRKSQDRMEIVNEINRLMWQVPILPEDRILQRPGVVEEPSESYRLRLKEQGLDTTLFEAILTNGNRKIQNILIDHPDITPAMLQTLSASGTGKRVRNKAIMLLNSKRYKQAHGLWNK